MSTRPYIHQLAVALVASWAILGMAPRPAAAQTKVYEVRNGDTLWGIAKQFGCSLGDLESANPTLDPDRIRPGLVLAVPKCPSTSAPKSSKQRSTKKAKSGGKTYKIRSGDYLEKIATEFGCSIEELQRANDLRTDSIYAGRTLQIPKCSGNSVQAARPAWDAEPRSNKKRRVSTNTTSLEGAMRERGFKPPKKFKAYVLEMEFDKGRRSVVRERSWDWKGTADDRSGWNPASTVKLFAAVGALRRAEDLGFTSKAKVTFHGRTKDRTFKLSELVKEAIGPSNNIAYDFLVQFSGFEWLHTKLFTERWNLADTSLRRAYERRKWMRMGESPSFTESPAITLIEGDRTKKISAAESGMKVGCGSAACTTLRDLAECMRRLMLQEQLPTPQSFQLDQQDLVMLRRALRSERKRGDEVVDALAESFSSSRVRMYHKAGYSGKWYSDVVYIYDPGVSRAWIVALAGYPGRTSLNQAARVIGRLLKRGNLR